MKRLSPTETDLVGNWTMDDGTMVGDETQVRIEALIRDELVSVAVDASGWEKLYRDPQDGRLWELTRPRSEMHGGGPKRLRLIGLDEARQKYTIP